MRRWPRLNWTAVYSWIDHSSTILSMPLAIIGFAIAITQINRTKKAAEAAQATAEAARAEANRSAILLLLPQLQQIEEHLDRAIEYESTQLVIAWSNTWRWQASRLRGHFSVAESSEDELLKHLQESVLEASLVKTALVGQSNVDLRKATRKMRDAITAVTSELGAQTVYYASGRGGGVDE